MKNRPTRLTAKLRDRDSQTFHQNLFGMRLQTCSQVSVEVLGQLLSGVWKGRKLGEDQVRRTQPRCSYLAIVVYWRFSTLLRCAPQEGASEHEVKRIFDYLDPDETGKISKATSASLLCILLTSDYLEKFPIQQLFNVDVFPAIFH